MGVCLSLSLSLLPCRESMRARGKGKSAADLFGA